MRGFKTYMASFLSMGWGIFGCFKVLPLEIWLGISLFLIGLCFMFSRWALRTSWSGAYKVYVKEKPDSSNALRKTVAIVRGD